MDESVLGVGQTLGTASVIGSRRVVGNAAGIKKLIEFPSDVNDRPPKITAAAAAQTTVNLKALSTPSLGNYQWNLPPHSWSLPVQPQSMGGTTADPQSINGNFASHKLRRGRIYWYSRVDAKYMDPSTPNQGPGSADPRYGFQFLYNPSEITTNVAVNTDITPTSEDKFAKVVGAFPSGEALTVSILLDRTNDFFCLRSHTNTQKQYSSGTMNGYMTGDFSQYYKHSLEKDFSKNFTKKLSDLINLGTISDVEYLYKAINGPNWVNPATGRETSDIGFLSPTLLRIDIGPLSYIGYVSNLVVTHNAFTQSMIPIRTTLSVSFNLMATAGLASGGTLVSK